MSKPSQSGFTLIELMVTLAIVGILLTVGVPSFKEFQRNSELTSFTNSLISTINTARGEAMKRGMNAYVIPADSSAWSSGWKIFVDTDRDTVFTSGVDILISESPAIPAYLNVTGVGATVTAAAPFIRYDAQGYSKDGANAPAALTLSVARNDVATGAQLDQTRRIKIAITGRVRSCKPKTDTTCTTILGSS